MMRKFTKLCLVLTLVVASMAVTMAQSKGEFGYGVKIGTNLCNYAGNDNSSKFGVSAGLFADYAILDKLSVSVETLFAQQVAKVEETLGTSEDEVVADFSLNLCYIQVPLLVQYKVYKNFGIKTGFQAGFLINEKSVKRVGRQTLRQDLENSPYYDLNPNTLDLSIPIALTYSLKSWLIVECRYNLGLSSITDNDNMAVDANDSRFPDFESFKNRSIALSVGFRF